MLVRAPYFGTGPFRVYGVHMSQEIRQSILRALGDGGTFDMVDGVMAYLAPLIDDDEQVLESSISGSAEPIQLVGLAEVAELTGESKATIGHWMSGRRKPAGGRVEFPAPRWTLECGPIWDRADIETFCDRAYPGDVTVTVP